MALPPIENKNLQDLPTVSSHHEPLVFDPEPLSQYDKMTILFAMTTLNLKLLKGVFDKVKRNWEKAQLRYPEKSLWLPEEIKRATGLNSTLLSSLFPTEAPEGALFALSTADIHQMFLGAAALFEAPNVEAPAIEGPD